MLHTQDYKEEEIIEMVLVAIHHQVWGEGRGGGSLPT